MRQWAGRRVAVTGVGVVVSCGVGKDVFWHSLLEGPRPTVKREILGWDPAAWLSLKEARRLDRFSQYALVATDEALADAGHPPLAPNESGVVIGTGMGGCITFEAQVSRSLTRGKDRIAPYAIPALMPNAAAAQVSLRYGLRGPVEAVTTACAAGTHSIAAGGELIASGRCKLVIAGGAEAAMTDLVAGAFDALGALSRSGISRPFDRNRDGLVLSEGAGILVLEELENAERRGTRIYAELAGAASNADCHHITVPAPSGMGAAECMQLACADAGLAPQQITYVNAHGTSTPLNDIAESHAIERVFGLPGPAVTSIKGATGHSLGAAGAIEAVSVMLSFSKRLIPPTLGLAEIDTGIRLDVVSGGPRAWVPGPTISNSFAFGGHNGTLVFTALPD